MNRGRTGRRGPLPPCAAHEGRGRWRDGDGIGILPGPCDVSLPRSPSLLEPAGVVVVVGGGSWGSPGTRQEDVAVYGVTPGGHAPAPSTGWGNLDPRVGGALGGPSPHASPRSHSGSPRCPTLALCPPTSPFPRPRPFSPDPAPSARPRLPSPAPALSYPGLRPLLQPPSRGLRAWTTTPVMPRGHGWGVASAGRFRAWR